MKIHFVINGKPQSKGRPRFRNVGNFVSTYTPKTTLDYEKKVVDEFKKVCNKDMSIYEGKIKIIILACFEPPKSTSKKKKAELINNPYLKKPDSDNIGKIILDGLNKVAYKDDSQVYSLQVYKFYSETERVEVLVEYEEE